MNPTLYDVFRGAIKYSLSLNFQRASGAAFHTLIAQDTFCAIQALTAIIEHIHIHGAHSPALAALDTFFLIHLDTDQSIIAGWLQEHGDGANIFTKSAVVFEGNCQRNANPIIENVANDEAP